MSSLKLYYILISAISILQMQVWYMVIWRFLDGLHHAPRSMSLGCCLSLLVKFTGNFLVVISNLASSSFYFFKIISVIGFKTINSIGKLFDWHLFIQSLH